MSTVLRHSRRRISCAVSDLDDILVEDLDIVTPVTGFNGGLIMGPDFSVPAIGQCTAPARDRHKLEVSVFAGDEWPLREANVSHVPLAKLTVGFRLTALDDLEALLYNAVTIVGASAHFELVAQCRICTALASETMVLRSQPPYLDITYPRANRGLALSQAVAVLGIALTEIADIGDGANEIAIFEPAGLGFVMGNAAPEMRQVADLVAFNDDDVGFGGAVMRFVPARARSRVAIAATQAGRHP